MMTNITSIDAYRRARKRDDFLHTGAVALFAAFFITAAWIGSKQIEAGITEVLRPLQEMAQRSSQLNF